MGTTTTATTTTETTTITIPHIDKRAASARLAHRAMDAADAFEQIGAVTPAELCVALHDSARTITGDIITASDTLHNATLGAAAAWNLLADWGDGDRPTPCAVPALMDAIDGAFAARCETDETSHHELVDTALADTYELELVEALVHLCVTGEAVVDGLTVDTMLDAAIAVAVQAVCDARDLDMVSGATLGIVESYVGLIAVTLDGLGDGETMGAYEMGYLGAVRDMLEDELDVLGDTALAVPLSVLVSQLDKLAEPCAA